METGWSNSFWLSGIEALPPPVGISLSLWNAYGAGDPLLSPSDFTKRISQ